MSSVANSRHFSGCGKKAVGKRSGLRRQRVYGSRITPALALQARACHVALPVLPKHGRISRVASKATAEPDSGPAREMSVGGGSDMALSKGEKGKIIGEFHVHEKDTGSPEVQVALLTTRISQLTEHLKNHKHDE